MFASSGNRGTSVRSDCYVAIELNGTRNIHLDIKSKTEILFGRQVRELVMDMMQFFGITGAHILIEDSGALPYVIAARTEAAISRLIHTDKTYLLPEVAGNRHPTGFEDARRSRLYLPGDQPKLMINAGLYGADGIILDLEDSVAPDKKTDARYLVRNALRNNDFQGAELMVRINQLPMGLEDLPYLIPHPLNLIIMPKCESAGQVQEADALILRLKGDDSRKIWLMPVIESALGIQNAFGIASASENVVAVAIGLEDYTADLGVERTVQGTESWYARSVLVNACVAAGVQPIDSVFSALDDTEGLRSTALKSKSMGFRGMGCIHPAQIPVIHACYNPDEKEIEKAKKVVMAFEAAQKEGKGVISLGSKMIDAPVVKRALHVVGLAIKNQMLNPKWRDEYEG